MWKKKNFYWSFPGVSLGCLFLLVMGLNGCGGIKTMSVTGANTTAIRELATKVKVGDTVYVQGKVEKKAPLIKQAAYEINDSTGKIWVVTNQTQLKPGEEVVIKGKLRYQSIPLGGKEYGDMYVEEY
ncbi:hypothetical protein [Calothrix sp. 336/3]|uniref:hypothetical protein n=1 Tax=Calothrix sp. 336/3 TaxID=1337936 RepID=UPI0004E46FE4|nr:hypothetical protein [Calothrix sp. 336/3]AKG24057.1 hypothetical protein IJ00_24540 [Calothrix sp. 336/3]